MSLLQILKENQLRSDFDTVIRYLEDINFDTTKLEKFREKNDHLFDTDRKTYFENIDRKIKKVWVKLEQDEDFMKKKRVCDSIKSLSLFISLNQ